MTVEEAKAALVEAALKTRDTSEVLDRSSMRYPRLVFITLHEAVRAYQQALLEAESASDGQ